MAAQIFSAAEDALPGLSDQIRRGEFAPLREWLRTEIHEVGSTYASPDDLLRAVTGDAEVLLPDYRPEDRPSQEQR